MSTLSFSFVSVLCGCGRVARTAYTLWSVVANANTPTRNTISRRQVRAVHVTWSNSEPTPCAASLFGLRSSVVSHLLYLYTRCTLVSRVTGLANSDKRWSLLFFVLYSFEKRNEGSGFIKIKILRLDPSYLDSDYHLLIIKLGRATDSLI